MTLRHSFAVLVLLLAACSDDSDDGVPDAGTTHSTRCRYPRTACYIAQSTEAEVTCLPASVLALMDAGVIQRGFSATAPDGVARTATLTKKRPLADVEVCRKYPDDARCSSADAGADDDAGAAPRKRYAECCYNVCYGPYE